MSAELRRQYFIAGLEIPEDTEAIEEPDGTMDFYKDGAPQGDSEEEIKEAKLGMGPEERRQIFNAGLEIPGDTEAVEPADDSMDCLLYTSPSPRDQRGSRMPSSA